MKKNYLLLLILAFAFLSGCKKDSPKDNDTKASEDNAFALSIFENTVSLADEAAYTTGPFTGNLSTTGVIVTYDTLNSVDDDTITINFGTMGSVGIDNRSRIGKVIIQYNGNYADSGSTHTITFLNYKVDNNQLLGTMTVVNKGPNAAGKTVSGINVNGQIMLTTGGTIIWYAQIDREWTSGQSTLNYWDDDIYTITGDCSGAQSTGPTFIAQINIPLIRTFIPGCRRHFSKGGFQLHSTDKSLRTVDFGSGTCDDEATVKINDETYTISLH